MKTFQVPELAWYGARLREFELPSDWTVTICCMAGHDREALTTESIAAAIRAPIGSRPLKELAGTDSRVAIVFDDMSRVTRCKDIIPPVLSELAMAGVPESHIRFIGATGCHRAMGHDDFVKKLGEEVVQRFAVYSHNPFGDCISVGTTSQGIEVSANAELLSCNLKIAIGSVVPHRAVGFSGGPKTILPGVCSFETIMAFHQYEISNTNLSNDVLMDRLSKECYPARIICDEGARMIGLDFKIDVIVNSFGETVALYAGHPEASCRLAYEDAQKHYCTEIAANADIVIANTYAKANESEAGLTIAFQSIARGGDIVLIANTPDGHTPHYLFGTWGSEPPRQHTRIPIPENIHHLYIFTDYPDRTLSDYFRDRDKVLVMSNWNELLKELTSRDTRHSVVVYPNADIQYATSRRKSGQRIHGNS